MKVHLFITCLNDAVFPKSGIAVTQVLERLGHEVIFDDRQTCCGQMHLNSGYRDEAVSLAKQWIEVFSDAEVIVSPSGSCVANVREMFATFANDTGDKTLAEAANALRGRVFEFSEFLLKKLDITDVGASFPHRVTYHPTCHGSRLLGLGTSPVRLLKAVQGLEYVELADHDQCCGFGGTFAVKNADTSAAMLHDKMAAIHSTKAEYCAAIDNSCLMHIGGGLTREGKGPKVIHLAEILASQEGR
jgi:L-lactate dehydrogenase complex protein LldE